MAARGGNRRRMRRGVALALLALALGAPRAEAQPVSLIADQVTYDRETGRLTASGHVEALYEDRVLRADRITYDEKTEQITASGSISVTDTEGTVFLADAAALSPDLTEGLIEGGRLLIAGQLQLAASEIRRTGGRYTTLQRTVASSCTICAENPRPTWSIRAQRVTLDEAAQRIYFEGARFEVLGLPVAYVPQVSIPDPRIRRASGFLIPSYHQSDIYGSGVKVPYYRVLGPSADATVTPFLTTDGAKLIEGQYRRRYNQGEIDLGGVFALDDGSGDFGRGAIDSSGSFRLDGGYVASFEVMIASDDSFLQEFDYSDDDRLTSEVKLERVRATDFVHLGAVGFQSLREDEETGTVPFVLPEFQYYRNGTLPRLGGFYGLEANALGITRREGRDVLRMGAGADWQRQWILDRGLVASAILDGDLELYSTRNDPDGLDGTDARLVPAVATELRWPLQRATGPATHVVSPIVQVVYSEVVGSQSVPNEDSQLPELDETNLFSLSRYPGRDEVETGLRVNMGVDYVRYDPDGWFLGMTVGRVLRTQDDADFPEGTGLTGHWSDIVAAVRLEYDSGLRVVNRALFDDDLTFRRNEFALGYDGDRTELEAAYTYFADDESNPILGPQPEIDELGFEGSYRFLPNWELRGLWRYDLASEQSLRAEGGLAYGNECAEFELSVSRRFTSSSNLPPATSIQFGVQLAGIGSSEGRDWPARDCRLRGI